MINYDYYISDVVKIIARMYAQADSRVLQAGAGDEHLTQDFILDETAALFPYLSYGDVNYIAKKAYKKLGKVIK